MATRWIYHYRCGCSDGPKPKSEMTEYCGIHGDDLQDAYRLGEKPKVFRRASAKRREGRKA